MKETKVISAFQACGKTYMASQYDGNKNIIIYDLDSDPYQYITDPSDGNIDKEWPNNYTTAIKELIGKVDILFVSSHREVRKFLFENSIPFDIVVPKNTDTCLYEWIGRMTHREDPNIRIDSMIYTWSDDLTEIENECTYKTIYHLDENSFISDIIWLDERPNINSQNCETVKREHELYKIADIVPDKINWQSGQKIIFNDGMIGTLISSAIFSDYVHFKDYLPYLIIKENGTIIPLTNNKYVKGGYTEDFDYYSRSLGMIIPIWSINKIYDVLKRNEDDSYPVVHRKLLWEREQNNKK